MQTRIFENTKQGFEEVENSKFEYQTLLNTLYINVYTAYNFKISYKQKFANNNSINL